MDELPVMKKGEIKVVYQDDSNLFPSVVLFSSSDQSERAEVLVEYTCDYDMIMFLRWSSYSELDREFFTRNCNLCGSQDEGLMMDIGMIDGLNVLTDDFKQHDSCDHVLRNEGVTFVCRGCLNTVESTIQDAVQENEVEFVAVNI